MISFFKKLFSKPATTSSSFIFIDIYQHLNKYPLQSEDNYIRALTHSSFTKKTEEKNERLEFLGDAVINFCVAEVLYHQMHNKDEGTMTKARASIVNRKNLNKVGVDIGIPKYLKHKLLPKQLEEAPDIIGNAFEALIGAYYIDYGMKEMEKLIATLLMKEFDAHNFHKTITDSKSYLLEWSQAQKKHLQFEHKSSVNENGLFEVALLIEGEVRATAIGKNKKEAEQLACKKAIELLQLGA